MAAAVLVLVLVPEPAPVVVVVVVAAVDSGELPRRGALSPAPAPSFWTFSLGEEPLVVALMELLVLEMVLLAAAAAVVLV